MDGGDPLAERDGSPTDGTVISLDGLVIEDGGGDSGVVLMGCMGQPDGVKCDPAPDLCHTDGLCKSGVCQPPGIRGEGYNWKQGDDFARCCGGKPITTNTDANCGVCGIKCNAMNGESCMALGGRWFCRGCTSSAACWSKCCSQSFNPPSCAASDCNGNCSAQYCPMGTVCKLGNGMSSNYCAYP